jgi:pilus assembly protein CpaF
MSHLQQYVEQIFALYTPLSQLQNQWGMQQEQGDFRQLVEDNTKELPSSIAERLHNEFFAWGPLESLREREDIFDVIVQGPEHIFFETGEGLFRHKDQFLSERSFKNFVERLTQEAKLLVDQKEPFANGKVGAFRVHLIIPPASQQTTITLRRHRQQVFSLQQLKASGFLSTQQMDFLQGRIAAHDNLLIVGPTGSGKTTFLNAILKDTTTQQRIVIIEDTDELQPCHPLHGKLLSRELCPTSLNRYDMGDLVKQALRMRPDRLVIGEVRGPEAKDLLQALATGHRGSLGTLHAESAQQALIRLEMLVQMGAPQWSLESIRRLILMSLDYLIVLSADRQQKGIKEIARIRSLESFGLLLEPIETSF